VVLFRLRRDGLKGFRVPPPVISKLLRSASNYIPVKRQALRDTYGTLDTHREAKDEWIQYASWEAKYLIFETSGGEGGIRTLGTGVSPYNGLAKHRGPFSRRVFNHL